MHAALHHATCGSWIQLARASRAADELLHKVAPGFVRKAVDPLTRDGFDDVVRDVALGLLEAVEYPETTAATKLKDMLLVNWSKLSASDRERAIRQAEALIARLGSQVAPPLRKVLAAKGKQIVATTKGAAVSRWELPIAAVWGEQDARIVDHATNSQAFYVTDYYGARATSLGQQARDIVARGLADGLDYQVIGKDLEAAIGQQLGRSKSYYPMVASVFAARSRTWSVLSTFEEAAIETWRFSAVMDEATCFARGTRILMGDGRTTKPIETIVPGDVVMSCKGRPRKVLATKAEPARKWGEMLFGVPNIGPLIVTRTHGILTSKGWIRAQRITTDDHAVIWTSEGMDAGMKAPTSKLWSDEREWGGRRGRHDARALNVAPWPHPAIDRAARTAQVTSVTWTETGRTEDAFDIEVDEDHGYIAEGVVVHNSHICRFLNNQVFSVQASADRFRQVAQSNDPAAVKDLQPFVRERRDEDGKMVMHVGDFQIARIESSGMGRKDDAGSFSGAANAKALEGRGIAAPPLHPHCRSELIPEGYAAAPRPLNFKPPPGIKPVVPGQAAQPVDVGPGADPNTLGPLVRPTRPTASIPFDFNPEALPPLPTLTPEEEAAIAAAEAKKKAVETALAKIDAMTAADKKKLFVSHGLQTITEDEANALPSPTPQQKGGAAKQKAKPVDVDTLLLDVDITSTKALKAAVQQFDPAKPIVLHKVGGKLIVPGDSRNDVIAAKLLGVKNIPTKTIDFDKVPKPKKQPPAPPTAAPIPAPLPKKLDAATILGDGKPVGPQKGSNPGGTYRGADGVERYVKFYTDPAKPGCEHLANTIYRDLGLGAPESAIFEHEGKTAYASKILPNVKTMAELGRSADRSRKILDGFAADVLTGNWDAVGLTDDNIVFDATGNAFRIDNGGTFLLRATNGRKPAALLNTISEWDFFFNGNPQYSRMASEAGVFSAAQLKTTLADQIDRITELRKAAGGWAAYVDRLDLPLATPDKQQVIDMLEARTTLLEAKAKALRTVKPAPSPTKEPFSFNTGDGARVLKKMQSLNSGAPAAAYDGAYRAAGMSADEQNEVRALVSGWVGEYRRGSTHLRAYEAARKILLGSGTATGKHVDAWAKAHATRRDRWRAVLDALGFDDIPVPEVFEAHRGLSGVEWVKAVAQAWAADADKITVLSDELASWSMLRGSTVEKFAYGGGKGDGVIHKWRVPIEQTMFDQVADDSSFITSFNSEHEVIAGPGHDNGIEVDARDPEVQYGGKKYTWDTRAALIKAMKRDGQL